MNVKHSVTGNDEPNFVFIVKMFAAEFRQHRVESRGLCGNVDHIGGDVTAAGPELVDLRGIGGKDFFLRRIGTGWMRGLPDFVINADAGQMFDDCVPGC